MRGMDSLRPREAGEKVAEGRMRGFPSPARGRFAARCPLPAARGEGYEL